MNTIIEAVIEEVNNIDGIEDKEMLQEEKENINRTRKSIADTIEEANNIDLKVLLPLENLEKLLEFEALIKLESNMVKFREFLAIFGGYNVKDNIKRIMDEIINDILINKVSWKGTKGNFALCNLEFMKILKTDIEQKYRYDGSAVTSDR